MHIFRTGCTIFKDVHLDCAHFFSYLSLLHTCIRRVHGEVPGCTVLSGVHPAGAQSKSLISDTGVHCLCDIRSLFGVECRWRGQCGEYPDSLVLLDPLLGGAHSLNNE